MIFGKREACRARLALGTGLFCPLRNAGTRGRIIPNRSA